MNPKRSIRLMLGVGCLLASLSGCQPGATLSPQPSLTPSDGSEAVGTPSTSLALPPSTPSALPTPPAETPSPELAYTAVAATLRAAPAPELIQESRSPNGAWEARVLRAPCQPVNGNGETAYEWIELSRLGTTDVTTIATQLQACGGLGAYGLEIEQWSADGRWLYTGEARQGTPDGLCGYWEPPLTGYDTQTGASVRLSAGPTAPDGLSMASAQNGELRVWDLQCGAGQVVARFDPALAFRGAAWSPDGQALAYLLTENSCFPAGRGWLYLAQPDGEQPRLLAEGEGLHSVLWQPDGRLLAFGEDSQTWLVDPTAGGMTQAEP